MDYLLLLVLLYYHWHLLIVVLHVVMVADWLSESSRVHPRSQVLVWEGSPLQILSKFGRLVSHLVLLQCPMAGVDGAEARRRVLEFKLATLLDGMSGKSVRLLLKELNIRVVIVDGTACLLGIPLRVVFVHEEVRGAHICLLLVHLPFYDALVVGGIILVELVYHRHRGVLELHRRVNHSLVVEVLFQGTLL